jgi:hypothetical protein
MTMYHSCRSYVSMLKVWSKARFRSDERRIRREVARGMELPALPQQFRRRGTVWAVSMVKNEADVVGLTVRHLLDQGVDGVLVVDNGSTDGTLECLVAMSEADSRVHVGHDRLVAYHQSVKMTFLAQAVRRAGADWVVPFDADEFWHGAGSDSLTETLRSAKPARIVVASVFNAFPTRDLPPGGLGRATLRIEIEPHHQVKVAFQSHRLATVAFGNHAVRRWGRRTTGLHILHVPWRSYEQFERKVVDGSASLGLAAQQAHIGAHWSGMAALGSPGRRHEWENILAATPAEDLGWMPRGPFRMGEPITWKRWNDSLHE